MTIASNTTAGQIKLTGDLSGTGESPELRATGVTAGTYPSSNVVIDAKGRVIYAKVIDTLSLTRDATTDQKGVVQIGSDINVNAEGVISVAPIPTATDTVSGLFKIDSSLTQVGDLVTVPQANTSIPGVVQIGSGINVNNGVISVTPVPTATDTVSGLFKIDSSLTQVGDLVTVPQAGATKLGLIDGVKITDANLTISNGFLNYSYTIPTSSQTEFGGAKIGEDLTISTDTLSYNYGTAYPPATTTTWGGAKIVPANGLNIDSFSQNASVNIADTNVVGIVKLGGNITGELDGTVNAQISSPSTLGIVKLGGNLGKVVSGANFAVRNILNFSSWLGTVKLGSYVSFDINGNLSLPIASTSNIGMISVDNKGIKCSDTGGQIFLNLQIAKKNLNNAFTASQTYAVEQITQTGTFSSIIINSDKPVVKITTIRNAVIDFDNNYPEGTTQLFVIRKTNDADTVFFDGQAPAFTKSQRLIVEIVYGPGPQPDYYSQNTAPFTIKQYIV